ncbi:MAG: SDR family NAD(P)-dependent oxidoreductase [Polyangiales bacterium]|nr:SDR family oxidoreductase [Myxococcales bacterium]MCB9658648.1 SDR family oxidoreductase [Sandaracinaceae bacterium]
MSESVFPEGVALVIGGSGGVGRVIATTLAQQGCDVAVTFRSNEAAAQAVVAEIEGMGRRASAHPLSLTDEPSVGACVAAVTERYGRLHTVVHAAGSPIDQPYFSGVTPEQWRGVMDADVNGFFHVAHHALAPLKAGGGGSFVYISSAGLARYPTGDVLSVAPKGAVEALLRAIAKEEGRFGVRANSVALGVIDAGMFHRLVETGELNQAYLDASKRNIALRRFGRAEEVAEAVAFLSSSRASYITGQTLMLDGGYSI